jgi:hypothetical protein
MLLLKLMATGTWHRPTRVGDAALAGYSEHYFENPFRPATDLSGRRRQGERRRTFASITMSKGASRAAPRRLRPQPKASLREPARGQDAIVVAACDVPLAALWTRIVVARAPGE